MRVQWGPALACCARLAILGLATVSVTALPAAAQSETPGWTHPLHARGVQPQRGTFSVLPWESIDMASGAVTLTVPGIVVPGPNGLDIAVRHVVNLGDSVDSRVEIAGPVYVYLRGTNPNLPGNPNPNPAIAYHDGSMRYTFLTGTSGVYMTHDYARFTKATEDTPIAGILETPDGLTYEFGPAIVLGNDPEHGYPAQTTIAYLARVRDAYGNSLQFDRTETGILRAVHQFLQKEGSSEPQERAVEFDYGTAATTVTYSRSGESEAWTYTRDSNHIVTEVRPPIGNPWTFAHVVATVDSQPPRRQFTVTTPNGGSVTYVQVEHSEVVKYAPRLPRWIIESRRASGSDGQDREWRFTFEGIMDGSTNLVGRVECTDGDTKSTRIYTHFKTDSPEEHQRRVFWTGLTINDGQGATLQSQTFQWFRENESAPVGAEFAVTTADQDNSVITESPYPLLVKSITTTRGGKPYVQAFSYRGTGTGCADDGHYNDYGHPCRVTDTGDYTRVTEYVYRHDFTPYVRSRVDSETVSDSEGAPAERSYKTTYEYDGNGFLEKRTQGTLVTRYTPNTVGQVKSVALPKNGGETVTSYTYDWGAVASTTTPMYVESRTIRSDGLVTSARRDAADGQPGENGGLAESWTYDVMGREVTHTLRDGEVIRTDYVSGPNPQVKTSRGTSHVVKYLDGYGRVRRTENAVGVRTRVDYDAHGRKIAESQPFYNESDIRLTVFAYDGLDRVKAVTRPDGTSVEYRYDGLDTTVTERDGGETRTTVQYWKASGSPGVSRLAKVLDARQQTTLYTYDILDALTAVCGPGEANAGDPSECTRSWQYDSSHLLLSESHPESGTTTYVYDANGLMWTKTDAANEITRYWYDQNNRLEQITQGGETTTFSYDVWDHRLQAGNNKVTTRYQYTGGLWLTRRTDTLPDGRAFVTEYQDFDHLGNPRQITYPSQNGRTIRFDRDNEGRVFSIREPATGLVFAGDIQYTASGAVKQYSTGNGLVHSTEFDAMDRPDTIMSGPLDLGYSYKFGSVVVLTDRERPGYTQHYTYDPLDRLWTATGIWGQSTYSYRASGDRTELVDARGTTTYGYTSHRLTSITRAGTQVALTYGATGRLEHDEVGDYSYTPEGLLKEARTSAGATITYAYDADGLRLSKTVGAQTTYYLHGGNGELLSEVAPSGVARDYIYLGGRLLAGVSGVGTPPCVVVPPDGHWKAEYFNSPTPGTTPVMVADHGTGNGVSRRWGSLNPGQHCGLSADGFSVRWSRRVFLDAGTYEFLVSSNDGARLRIDGELFLDQMSPHDGAFPAIPYTLPTGRTVEIVFEYNDVSGEAYASLRWRRTGSEFGQLKGRVVLDYNGNAAFDADDQFLTAPTNPCARSTSFQGLSVTWTGPASGSGLPTNCTAGDGAWFSVVNIPPGTYTLSVTTPAGWPQVSQQVIVGPGESSEHLLYLTPPADARQGWVTGHILVDSNGNEMDEGEQDLIAPATPCPGRVVGGVRVTLSGPTTVSSVPDQCWERPGFLIEHLPPGDYEARLTGLPPGWSDPGPLPVKVNPGQEALPVEFRVRPSGTLSSRILVDYNGDSVLNGDDHWVTAASNPCAQSVAMEGVSVAWQGPNGTSGSGAPNRCTPDGARFSVPDMYAGDYSLTLSLPPGWRAVTPDRVRVTVNSDSDGSRPHQFSIRPDVGWVVGHILVDSNGNSEPDPEEPYLVVPGTPCPGQVVSGLQVSLVGPSSATTVPNQCWETPGFLAENLPPGLYTVSLTGLPSGWWQSGPTQVELHSWQEGGAEFRVRPPGDLRTRIVVDYAANQAKDGGDQFVTAPSNPCAGSMAVEGFVVSWSGAVNGSAALTGCDQYGAFALGSGLPAGDYSVTVVPPSGWDSVGPQTLRVSVPSGGDPVEQRFYVRPREGWVTGHILVDVNANGHWDEGEQYVVTTGMPCPGRVVNGLGVSLSGAAVVSGAPNRCEEQPAFLFDHVPTGTYQARLTGLPAGWREWGSGQTVVVNTGQPAEAEFRVQPPGDLRVRIVAQTTNGGGQAVTAPSNPCGGSMAVEGFVVSWSGAVNGSATLTGCDQYGAFALGSALPAGDYAVTVARPSGWEMVGAQTVRVTVPSGRTVEQSFSVQPPPPPQPPGTLFPGQQLYANEALRSPDGRFVLVYQGDGNLVLYNAEGRPLWASNTGGTSLGRTLMQGDGNLVVYDAGWQARWASGTGGAGPAYLAVENSGNVAIYRSSDGARLWQTGTNAPPPPPPSSGRLTAGQRLDANDSVESPDGRFSLVYQTDGNLVLYNWQGSGYWGTGTDGTAPGRVEMQGDGNLVIYDGAGQPVWASGTDGYHGAYLAVENNGNLVIYTADGIWLWQSDTAWW